MGQWVPGLHGAPHCGAGVMAVDAVATCGHKAPNAIQPDREGAKDMKDDIVIVSAARTPVEAFNGVFANLPAHELGKVAIKAAPS